MGLGGLNNQLRCIEETKAEEKAYWLHKYPWNLALGYTSLQWLDSNQRRCVSFLQNALKYRYSPSLDLTPNLQLGWRNKHTQGLTPAKVRSEIKEMTETRGLEVSGLMWYSHEQATCNQTEEEQSCNRQSSGMQIYHPCPHISHDNQDE